MDFKLGEIALFAFFSSLFLATAAFAQQPFDLQRYLGSAFDVDALAQFLFPGLPPEWLRVPQVIWYVILPFIAVFTVLYGLLRELRIFRFAPNKVNIVLAFAMTMLLLPSGVLTFVVVNLYAFGAAFAAIAFFVVFIIGIVLWGAATGWRLWGEVEVERAYSKSLDYIYKDIKRLNSERIRLVHELRTTPIENRQNIEDRLNTLNTKIREHEERLRSIKRSF